MSIVKVGTISKHYLPEMFFNDIYDSDRHIVLLPEIILSSVNNPGKIYFETNVELILL